MALRSKKSITICRAIPAFIPRQLALDVLHDHAEVITLNPLVLSHRRIPPPKDAPADEVLSTWYEITERIQFIPGLGKAGASTIQFNGVFHDVPWGLQTHIYAPMSIDMRAQYRVAGIQGDADATSPRELGLESIGAPKEGLYLRADIDFKCNVALASFVKNTSTSAIGDMVSRMVKKAEQLDADVLQRMMNEERDSAVSSALSKNSDPWTRPHLTQTQSTPEVPSNNGWSNQAIKHAATDIQELESAQNAFPPQQERQLPPQNAYQQQQPTYAQPTYAVELDGGHSATSDGSSWAQSPVSASSNHDNNNFYDNYSYHDPHQHKSSYYSQHHQQPHVQASTQFQYPDAPSDYQLRHAATRQHSQYQPPSQKRNQQFQQNYPSVPELPSPQQHQQQYVGWSQQQQNKQPQVMQMESGRKYSFDADRLQGESLTVTPVDQRRWSGVGL